MTPLIHHCDQRSEEWFSLRAGKLTASNAGHVLATVKTGEAAARRNLRVQLLIERLTGKPLTGGYVSKAMATGTEREPLARAAYQALTGMLVQEVGFVSSQEYPVGCSPDAVIFAADGSIDRVIELKCPEESAHFEYWKTGHLPLVYTAQIIHALWVTGANACDWMSFNPNFPEDMQCKLIHVQRNDGEIRAYAEHALAFLEEVDAEYRQVETITKENRR